MAKKKDMMSMCGLTEKDKKGLVVSEVAFFVALYYFLYILQVQAHLIGATIILFVLINVSIFTCPIMGKCMCK